VLPETSRPTRFGFVSTYPPTQCGLATFTAALRAELAPNQGPVVRVVDQPQPRPGTEVVAQFVAGDTTSVARAIAALVECDVVVVQHEYGVFGGADGDEVLPLLRALSVPSIVVLHTVLTAPSAHQKEVLEAVAALSDAVVVMGATAHDRLARNYAVDMAKVSVIPHGAADVRAGHAPTFRTAQPVVLTWGLIGPGKGIEWGIAAMAELQNMYPAPSYHIAGQTHPKVLLNHGERYRDGLMNQVLELGLTSSVRFDRHYRNAYALAELINSADVVLLPYDSTDQVTSGVLIEAVAALKPVVATRFPHAVELLGNGAGLLVDHKDPAAIAAALRALLTQRDLAASMTKAAQASASELLWPAVADHYRQLAIALIGSRVAA
jgi:glycosyltransferase involved in cell wall biosynthesis